MTIYWPTGATTTILDAGYNPVGGPTLIACISDGSDTTYAEDSVPSGSSGGFGNDTLTATFSGSVVSDPSTTGWVLHVRRLNAAKTYQWNLSKVAQTVMPIASVLTEFTYAMTAAQISTFKTTPNIDFISGSPAPTVTNVYRVYDVWIDTNVASGPPPQFAFGVPA